MIVAKLSWKDNSANEQGFRIYRSIGSAPLTALAQVGPGITVYENDLTPLNLAEGTEVGYSISGFNAAGETALLPEVSGNIPPMIPNPPSGLVVQIVALS